jgi:hypothetical protein
MWNRSRVAGVPDYAKIPFDNRTPTRRYARLVEPGDVMV